MKYFPTPLAILLPPSEGKAGGGTAPKWKVTSGAFGKTLHTQRSELLDALTAANGGNTKLLGVTGKNLELARMTNIAIGGAPTLPAWQRYTGVVWEHMSPQTLDRAPLLRACESIVVLSGLLGLVSFNDLIPDYKLKMGASLAPLGKVSTWWREPLSRNLNAWLAGRYVIDLLPQDHRSAWKPQPQLFAAHDVITFVEKSGKVAGHDAKAAKGLFIRYLLESTKSMEATLKSWKHPRFHLEIT